MAPQSSSFKFGRTVENAASDIATEAASVSDARMSTVVSKDDAVRAKRPHILTRRAERASRRAAH